VTRPSRADHSGQKDYVACIDQVQNQMSLRRASPPDEQLTGDRGHDTVFRGKVKGSDWNFRIIEIGAPDRDPPMSPYSFPANALDESHPRTDGIGAAPHSIILLATGGERPLWG
jgi:hypothetical protein